MVDATDQIAMSEIRPITVRGLQFGALVKRGSSYSFLLQLIAVVAATGMTLVLYGFLGMDHNFPAEWKLPVGEAIDAIVDATVRTIPWLFSGIRSTIITAVDFTEHVLLSTSPLVIAAVVVIAVATLASVRLALFGLVGITFVGATGLWEPTMETAALMAVALLFAVVFGLVLGVLAARSDRFTQLLRPVLDAMQSCPSLVYFIPFLIVFGTGAPSAVLITIIYSLPPVVRLTNLGLREVPPEAIEAARAFGASKVQVLTKVELPLARPSIMLGVNQTVMLALSVVVMAGMIGAGGLGIEVWRSVQQLRFGRGLQAGLAIVFIAILIDRLGYALSQPRITPGTTRSAPVAGFDGNQPSVDKNETMRAKARRHVGRLAKRVYPKSGGLYPAIFQAAALIILATAAALALPSADGNSPGLLTFSLNGPVDNAIRWFNLNVAPYIHPVRDFLIRNILLPFVKSLLWMPWPIVTLVVGWLAFRRRGAGTGLISVAALFLIGMLGMWQHAMTTLAIVGVAVAISVTLGVAIGILMAKSNVIEAVGRAVLDVMQTLPIFLFIIPAVMFLGIGIVAGIFATVIYSMPPVIRLTNLGLRQVNIEMVEAARAFGATESQVLWKVRIAAALPSIMLGVTQTTMSALAMVVVSAMIGTIGLGERVMWAVGSVNLPLGFEAGVSVITLAMLLDRILQGGGGGKSKKLAA
ncbi:hypothetical protein B5P45_22325 [Phyllobacterium zundukense]|uniref:ABC transmembrane type-1 domain-containing protein n=2 Tax=Phyllobacterium zundukense TaxID=1867719 RepID=A0A2N9VT79_9HYPH|nr:hypothetical protein B5P45_22325 [Phyllobacterium zundukense]